MIKTNKLKLLISSVIILLPILFGVVLWNELPEQMATHWGADGNANGWSSKAFAVFGLPLIVFFLHWVCMLVTANDNKNNDQNKKIFGMIFWICPIISIFANGVIYSNALGKEVNVETWTILFIGVMFVVLGNYLPKCRQNHTIGIKIKWTLQNEENWNKTHRLSGKVWVAGGLLLIASAFLPQTVTPLALIVILPTLAIVPIVYSYVYHKKQTKN